MAEEGEKVRGGMTEAEMRVNLIRLVFEGDLRRFEEFCHVLGRAIPLDTAAVVRGSSVTGMRATDRAPFDAEGPGSSDVDLTLVGGDVIALYDPEAFYIPGAHTKPLSDEHPDIAPTLVPLRQQLSSMVGRPVNVQATRDWVMFVREYLMGQPFLTILGKVEEA